MMHDLAYGRVLSYLWVHFKVLMPSDLGGGAPANGFVLFSGIVYNLGLGL